MLEYSHMVVSFSEIEGEQIDTHSSLDEAEAFAERLADEGLCHDIYLCRILRRVPCRVLAAEDFGVLPGVDYPAGLRPPLHRACKSPRPSGSRASGSSPSGSRPTVSGTTVSGDRNAQALRLCPPACKAASSSLLAEGRLPA